MSLKPKKADIGSKRLISLDPQGWIRWILQNPEVIVQGLQTYTQVSVEGNTLRLRDPNGSGHLVFSR